MTNRGALGGVTPNTWVNYEPSLLCAANGSVTHPEIGAGAGNRARWLRLERDLIVYQVQMNRGITTNAGTGDCYVVDLPFPARRMQRGVPQVIGQVMPYKTVTANPWECAGVVTLADAWSSLGGNEDRYCQFYIPWIQATGTGTWPISTTAQTITHSLGYAPAASDITWTLSSRPTTGTGNGGQPIISAISTTQFTVTYSDGQLNGAGGTCTYGWKIRTDGGSGTAGSWLAGPNRPWNPTFESFFFQTYFETA